jgi:hypothetical protein
MGKGVMRAKVDNDKYVPKKWWQLEPPTPEGWAFLVVWGSALVWAYYHPVK